MADPVQHPKSNSPPPIETTSSTNSGEAVPSKPPQQKPNQPPAGTYVVQIPKDQIYRYPPPENSRRIKSLSSRKPRRSCCCRCLCFTLGFVILLLIAASISAGVLYLVFKPESPDYTIADLSIRRFNLTSTSPISPEFDVTVRANNPNDKIGIRYVAGSSIDVVYSDVNLCDGKLPAFYQPANNVTVFLTALKGSDIALSRGMKTALMNQQKQGRVPFRISLNAPVKIKVGSVETWEITVEVRCDVVVDGLSEKSAIVSKDCDYSVSLW